MAGAEKIDVNEMQAGAKEDASHKSFFDSMWADVTGAVLTIASGALATWRSVDRIFYQNIKIEPQVKQEIETSKTATEAILSKVKSATGAKGTRRQAMRALLPEQHLRHDRAINTILARDYEIENIVDKLILLRPHQRLEVAFNALTTMAVTLGVVATAVSIGHIYNKHRELEKRLDGIEKQGNHHL